MTDEAIAAGIKELVARGKEHGCVTVEEFNTVLPADQVSSEQIEDAMSLLSELGIDFVEATETPVGKGKIDHATVTREIIARYPKILAALAK